MTDINYKRQLAMAWWKRFTTSDQNELIKKHMSNRSKVLEGIGLTGREIETIFNAEIPDINVQILINTNVLRVRDNKVLCPYIPDHRLGVYLSLMYLQSEGKNINKLVEKSVVDMNPNYFKYF